MGLKNLFNLLQDFERVCVCVESAQKRKPINLHDCSLYRHITWYRTTRPTIPLFWFWIYLFIYDWWWGWWWSSWKWCTLLTWEGVPIINTLQFSYEKIANNDEDDEITNTTTKKIWWRKVVEWNETKPRYQKIDWPFINRMSVCTVGFAHCWLWYVCLCTTFILINIGFWSLSRPRKRNTSLTEPLYIIILCQPAIKQAKKTLKELRRKDDAFAWLFVKAWHMGAVSRVVIIFLKERDDLKWRWRKNSKSVINISFSLI